MVRFNAPYLLCSGWNERCNGFYRIELTSLTEYKDSRFYWIPEFVVVF